MKTTSIRKPVEHAALNGQETGPKYNSVIQDVAAAILRNPKIGELNGSYDMDHINAWLPDARDAASGLLKGDSALRSNVRALASLTTGSSWDAAVHVHSLLDNPNLSRVDVQNILDGHRNEVPFATIQKVGKMLRNGYSHTNIAEYAGVHRNTVAKIDKAVGATVAREDRLINHIIADMDEGTFSLRKFEEKTGVPFNIVRRLAKRAREIREELAA